MKNGPFPLPPPSATSLRANPRLPTLVRGSEQPEHPMADPAGTPAPSSANGIALTFPDGARREYPQGTTGLDIAKGISPSLAKRTVAMALDGQLADLSDPIGPDAQHETVLRRPPAAPAARGRSPPGGPPPAPRPGRTRKSVFFRGTGPPRNQLVFARPA